MTTKQKYTAKVESIESMISSIQQGMKAHAEDAHENGTTISHVTDLIEVEKRLSELLAAANFMRNTGA